MDRAILQHEILKFLQTSTIPEHEKTMLTTLLPIMHIQVLENMYVSLKKEQERLTQLGEKKKRIELKYKVMVEKLCKMRSEKD